MGFCPVNQIITGISRTSIETAACPNLIASMESSNLRLGKAFGIEILLHWSFFLIPLIIIWLSVQQGDSAGLTAVRLVLLVLILACVLWHELGHALMARAFGIPTRDILLTPVCGLARLARAPETPGQEIAVALAGPLANGLVAVVAGLAAWGQGRALLTLHDPLDLQLLPAIFQVNLALCVLNLVPIFPMDGGRVLRALLAIRLPPARATHLAARTGQAGSLLVMAGGLVWLNPALLIIGVFLLIAAQQEIRWNRLEWFEETGAERPPGAASPDPAELRKSGHR